MQRAIVTSLAKSLPASIVVSDAPSPVPPIGDDIQAEDGSVLQAEDGLPLMTES